MDYVDCAIARIDDDLITSFELGRTVRDVYQARYVEFSSNGASMRKETARTNDDGGGFLKERCPRRVCVRRDENLPSL